MISHTETKRIGFCINNWLYTQHDEESTYRLIVVTQKGKIYRRREKNSTRGDRSDDNLIENKPLFDCFVILRLYLH